MASKKVFYFFFFLTFIFGAKLTLAYDPHVKKSTEPIGSPFFRHLAHDFDVNMNRLYRFERRGFGRSEIITLVLLHKITGTPMKEYGKRRVRKEVTLEKLAKEAGVDYVTLYKTVRVIKEGIESKGASNLPPPVFEKTKEEIKAEDEAKKKKSSNKKKGKK